MKLLKWGAIALIAVPGLYVSAVLLGAELPWIPTTPPPTTKTTPSPPIASPAAKPSLTITQAEMTGDEIGSVVVGRVTNNGAPSRYVRVNCDFESNGRLIDTAGMYAEPTNLESGQTASFKVRSLQKGATSFTCKPSAQ